MKSKYIFFGIFIGALLFGCVSATFNYKWFYPEFVSYEGKLLGKRPSEDLDARICAVNTQTGEHGCVVMLKPEFKALTQDYLETKTRLIQCERGQ